MTVPHIRDYQGKRIHMIGIGGSSMSGLAQMLKEKGYIVSGSDNLETYTTRHLRDDLHIPVTIGHHAENVHGADLVVYTVAILPDNPERVELERLGLEEPKDWDDLLKPEYKGLIWMSNPNTAGTAKLVINTMVQMKGHDEAMKYFVELDKNIAQYTKSGSGPSKKVGIGECVIGIGFLHDGITQILDGYDNISLVIPASGTSFEIGATAIFKGAKHPNAAKLWIEFALSPDCVNIAKENESFQFLVIDNAEQPEEATAFGLDPENVIDYDFEDAKNNTSKYVEDYFNALGAAADGRFQTE